MRIKEKRIARIFAEQRSHSHRERGVLDSADGLAGKSRPSLRRGTGLERFGVKRESENCAQIRQGHRRG